MTGTKETVQVDGADGDSVEVDFSMAGVDDITVLVDDNSRGKPSEYRLIYNVSTGDDTSMKKKRVLNSSAFSHDFKPVGDDGYVRVVNTSGGTATHRVRVIYE